MREDLILVDGKSYISSKRASKKYGYTMDYLGQLARGGKILSKMFGRTRYFDESSIENYISTLEQVAVEKIAEISLPNKVISAESTPEIPEQTKEVVSLEPSPVVVTKITENVLHTVAPQPTPIRKIEREIISSYRAPIAVGHNSYGLNLDHFSRLNHLFAGAFTLILVLLLTVTLNTGSRYNYKSDRYSVAAAQTSAENFATELDKKLFTQLDLMEKYIIVAYKKIHDGVIALFYYTTDTPSPLLNNNSGVAASTSTQTVVTNTNVVAPSDESIRRIVSEVLDEKGVITVESLNNNSIHQGVVALPSSGSQIQDEALKQQIKNSFSDEVQVTLDPSRTAGVVSPIFKNVSRSGDYMFVMVPVKE